MFNIGIALIIIGFTGMLGTSLFPTFLRIIKKFKSKHIRTSSETTTPGSSR